MGLVWKPTSPQGSPSIPRASSPRGIHPRGVQHAPLEVHCVGVSGPGERNIPAESRPACTLRGEVPVLVSLARLPEVERECRRRLISSSKAPTSRRQPPLPVSLQSPPPFAGDSRLLVPPHLLAPHARVSPILTSFLVHLAEENSRPEASRQEAEEILAWIQHREWAI